ncbi:uncharacterized protein [Diadema antillarum]|uniref:uncharacterized protein n=1 Tax=Diadema antillarum TaxID=105358 RepID=UPI003A88D0DF
MASSNLVLLATLLGLLIGFLPEGSRAHICIITPRQRGDFDISQPGSKTCVRHEAPCGGQSPEQPRVTYVAGQTALIRFQQNLNHYEVGLPGYMDISLSANTTSTDFRTLAALGDTHEYAQWNQRNYTVAVVMPNVTCDHCVLRMRYVSHKEGEEIFYQCSDIAIKSNQTNHYDYNETLTKDDRRNLPNSLTKAMALTRRTALESRRGNGRRSDTKLSYPSLYGISWNPLQERGSHLITIDEETGAIEPKLALYFGVGPNIQYGTPSPSALSQKYIMDAITCYSREIPYVFLLEHRNGDLDARPNKILWIDMQAYDIAGEYEVEGLADDAHITALNSYQRTTFLTFAIQPTPNNPGNFTFLFGTLDYMGNYVNHFTEPKTDDLYVNFLYATEDLKRQMYYVLLGDENAPVKLNARIHSYNITSNNVTKIVEVDVSKYTVNAIQVYEKTGQLLAVSPGLFPQQYPPWYLVTVDPNTGDVSPVMQIAPSGMFAPYYGGAVVNIDQSDGILFYVFRVADSMANIIATVALETGDVTFSQLTSLQFVHNIAYFDPYN